MKTANIPTVKLGVVAVSRDCFPIALSTDRKNRVCGELAQSGVDAYNCPTTVENEKDMEKALEEVRKAGCNALVVYLGNFGPETPETLLAKYFTEGPVMFAAAAEHVKLQLQSGAQKYQGIHTPLSGGNPGGSGGDDTGIYPDRQMHPGPKKFKTHHLRAAAAGFSGLQRANQVSV